MISPSTYVSYLGGNGSDRGDRASVGRIDRVFAVGYTASTGFP